MRKTYPSIPPKPTAAKGRNKSFPTTNNLTGNVPARDAHTWNGGRWYTEMRLKGNRLTATIDQSHLKYEKETRERFLPHINRD